MLGKHYGGEGGIGRGDDGGGGVGSEGIGVEVGLMIFRCCEAPL